MRASNAVLFCLQEFKSYEAIFGRSLLRVIKLDEVFDDKVCNHTLHSRVANYCGTILCHPADAEAAIRASRQGR
jgi:hypothetical protein